MSDNEVLLPHSEQAERGTLGGILVDPDAFFTVDTMVAPQDFYIGAHGDIYRTIAGLVREGMAADILTVGEALKAKGVKQHRGEPIEAYLIGLMTDTPTSVNTADYARIVEAAATRRRLHHAANTINKLATNNGHPIDKILSDSEKALFEVTDRIATKGIIPAREGLGELWDVIQQRKKDGGDKLKIPTKFIDLDRLLKGGMRKSQLIVLAGRPGMGKSIFESCVAYNVARAGKGVVRFNLEMSAESLYMRLLANATKIPFDLLDEGKLSDRQQADVDTAVGKLTDSLPMFVDDSAGLSLSQMAAKARRLKVEHDIKLITVDYMQLMSVERSYGNRTQDVGQLSRGLKRLAKELRVPILALAQLSRAVENRNDKHPQLADLRDSGEIEQDADVVMFLYRDSYYNPDTAVDDTTDLDVAKQRNGPTGRLQLYFDGPTMRFENMGRTEKIRL